MNRVLEVCTEWILGKQASYLCIEDKVIWYTNVLKKGGDFKWKFASPTETIRIIKYTLLTPREGKLLTPEVLIQVMQELGEVYEFGVKSDLITRPEVFNFSLAKPVSRYEDITKQIVHEVTSKYKGITLSCYLSIDKEVKKRLTLPRTSQVQRNKYIRKYLNENNFELRERGFRVLFEGKKIGVILRKDCKPSSIIRLSTQQINEIAEKIL